MLKAQFKSTESIDLLDGSSISYLLIRKYRRSIGLRITKNGLIVNAPIFVFGGNSKQNRDGRSNFNTNADAKAKQNIKDHKWLF